MHDRNPLDPDSWDPTETPLFDRQPRRPKPQSPRHRRPRPDCPLVRSNAPQTSKDALPKARKAWSGNKIRALEAIQDAADRGAQDDEIEKTACVPANSLRPVLLQLEDDGLILRIGTRKNANGNNARVWYAAGFQPDQPEGGAE